jgi:WhiB family redox-sensing transcriptional regulator
MYRDANGNPRRKEKIKSGDGIPSPTFNGPCRGQTDLFYRPFSNKMAARILIKEVKAICNRCVHIVPCREWGIKHEEFGVWGGWTEQERRAYRINHEITLERPEALTIETVRIGQKSKKVSVELPEVEEVEDQWQF